MLGSDIGHWDVSDIDDVMPEAYELVEDGRLDDDQFRAFACDNVIRLHGRHEPRVLRRHRGRGVRTRCCVSELVARSLANFAQSRAACAQVATHVDGAAALRSHRSLRAARRARGHRDTDVRRRGRAAHARQRWSASVASADRVETTSMLVAWCDARQRWPRSRAPISMRRSAWVTTRRRSSIPTRRCTSTLRRPPSSWQWFGTAAELLDDVLATAPRADATRGAAVARALRSRGRRARRPTVGRTSAPRPATRSATSRTCTSAHGTAPARATASFWNAPFGAVLRHTRGSPPRHTPARRCATSGRRGWRCSANPPGPQPTPTIEGPVDRVGASRFEATAAAGEGMEIRHGHQEPAHPTRPRPARQRPNRRSTAKEPLEASTVVGLLGRYSGRWVRHRAHGDPTMGGSVPRVPARIEPGRADLDSMQRIEGASDPDDLQVIAALTCPSCGREGCRRRGLRPERLARGGRACGPRSRTAGGRMTCRCPSRPSRHPSRPATRPRARRSTS